MTPAIPITDPRFVYVPSHLTNIRELFKRVRQQQAQDKRRAA